MDPSSASEPNVTPKPARFANAWVLFTPVDLVREVYTRYGGGDRAGVLALLATDVEIVQTGELPWAGQFAGHDGARRFYRLLHRHTEAKVEPLTYVSAGDVIAVAGKFRGASRASGKPFAIDVVQVWTVARGKVVRCVSFADTPMLRLALALG